MCGVWLGWSFRPEFHSPVNCNEAFAFGRQGNRAQQDQRHRQKREQTVVEPEIATEPDNRARASGIT